MGQINRVLIVLGFCFIGLCITQCYGLPFGRQQDDKEETETGDHENVDPILFIREDLNDTKKYLLIDDMIISKDPHRAGLLNAAWPNGIVPYSFAMTMLPQQRVMIAQAIAELSSRTCLQFRPASNSDSYWLVFQNDPLNQGCSSFVGWQNRRNQPVQLSAQCSKGNAIHEIIHAVGFFHEQTREDRDLYVVVHHENVMAGYEGNFKKDSDLDPPIEFADFGVPYNYDSIMHYGKNYFTKNGKPTIEVLNNPSALGNGDDIGQRDYLSPGDLEMLNKKYICPTIGNIEDGLSTTLKPPAPGIGNPMCQISPQLPICKV